MTWLPSPIKSVRLRRWPFGVWGVLALLFLTAPVPAQVDDTELLDGLGNDDYFVRQAVTRTLLSDNTVSPEVLDRLFITSETPEQRHRLLLVARHHLIRRMIEQRFGDQAGPGSMGLSHHVVRVTGPDEVGERSGVMVVMTLPGFPAYALLEPGDVIVDFADQPIPERFTPAQFQQMIRTHEAGDEVDLTVMRNGRPLQVSFLLCQGQALGAVYDDTAVTLSEPYRGRWLDERIRMQALMGGDEAARPAE